MKPKQIDINRLQIASPCPVSWDSMSGDDRSRFCSACELNVFNVVGMTTSEVEELLERREGRLCMRLYRRADGTILTADCPVGLRAVRKRAASIAGAAFAAVIGLFSVSYGQKDNDAKRIDASKIPVARTVGEVGRSSLDGTVVDVNGAIIPNVKILLLQGTKRVIAQTMSDADGNFVFASLPAGIYNLKVPAIGGFRALRIENLDIRSDSKHSISLLLEVSGETVLVGVVGETPLIDMTSNDRKTVITREMLDRGVRPWPR